MAGVAGADATGGWGTEGVVVGVVAGVDAGGVACGVVTADAAVTGVDVGDFLTTADEGAAVDMVTGDADAFDGAMAPMATTKNGRKARRLRKCDLVMTISSGCDLRMFGLERIKPRGQGFDLRRFVVVHGA